jgi:hypothetical protein
MVLVHAHTDGREQVNGSTHSYICNGEKEANILLSDKNIFFLVSL